MINQIPPSDEMFNQLSGSFIKHSFEGLVSEKNDRSKKIAILLLIVILAYAGVEAVKVIFRNNFGKNGLSITKLIFSFLAFIAVGFIALDSYSTFDINGGYSAYDSKNSFLYTSIFYFALALFLLIKGVIAVIKRTTNNVHPSYRGDSVILGFLMESGWSQAKVQNLAEPLTVLIIGIFLLPLNLFLGLPLIFCAISVWFHYGYEAYNSFLLARDELANNRGFPSNSSHTFSHASN